MIRTMHGIDNDNETKKNYIKKKTACYVQYCLYVYACQQEPLIEGDLRKPTVREER